MMLIQHFHSTLFNIVEFNMVNAFGHHLEWCWFNIAIQHCPTLVNSTWWTCLATIQLFFCFQVWTTVLTSIAPHIQYRTTKLYLTILDPSNTGPRPFWGFPALGHHQLHVTPLDSSEEAYLTAAKQGCRLEIQNGEWLRGAWFITWVFTIRGPEVNANFDVPDVMYGNRKAIVSFLRQFGCQRVKTKTFKQELSYSWCKAEAHQ